MNVCVVLLGFITATLLSGEADPKVRIKAYNATGELDIRNNVFTLGTSIFLTCDVTELPEGSEVVSYRWFRNCTGDNHGRCQIQDRDSRYRVMNDTLLVDVTSWDQGGKYYCFVNFNILPQSSYYISIIIAAGGSRPPPPTTITTPPGNTDKSPATPSGPQGFSTDDANMQHYGEQSTIGTFIGVGVGGSMFLLLVSSISVVIILVVVVMRRKVAYKQKKDKTMGDSLHHSNPVVAEQETELKESGVGADYKDAAGYQDVDEDMGEEEVLFSDGLDPYEVFDRKAHTKNALKVSTPIASATNLPAMNAIVDKNGAEKETGDRRAATNNDLYAMPMRKMGKMTGKGEGMVKSGGVEEEQYDDTVSSHYEPFRHADSELW